MRKIQHTCRREHLTVFAEELLQDFSRQLGIEVLHHEHRLRLLGQRHRHRHTARSPYRIRTLNVFFTPQEVSSCIIIPHYKLLTEYAIAMVPLLVLVVAGSAAAVQRCVLLGSASRVPAPPFRSLCPHDQPALSSISELSEATLRNKGQFDL